MNKNILCIVGVFAIAVLWWLFHTPEIQWYDAKSYIGKRVTAVGPIISENLNAPDNLVTMTMGTGMSSNDWESSLHILVPRKNLTSGWTQKDLEKGAVMKWTGLIQTGLVNSVWLYVEPISN